MSLNWGKIYDTDNRIDRVGCNQNLPTLRMVVVYENKGEELPEQGTNEFYKATFEEIAV
tara:strand:+ start:357 stop:533 length:177 start_codon:yes stop_codon:yes gene_type:complete